MPITIVAIAKNEEKYIAEWIAHHLSLGVDQLIVFDNESTDSTHEVLQTLSGSVPLQVYSWQTIEGISPQLSAYNFALRELCREGDLAGFIDIDEFLIPTHTRSLPEILAHATSQINDAGAVCINQRVFGSSWLDSYSPEPVLERFTLCSEAGYAENAWMKTFYKVGCVEQITGSHSSKLSKGIHVHASGQPVQFDGDGFNKSETIDYSAVQLNHYITKSLEEFLWKRQRGGAAAANRKDRMQRYESMDFYNGRQPGLNVMKDPATELHAERIGRLVEALSPSPLRFITEQA